MSGGSFDYLSETQSLAALLAERDNITGTAEALRERGHTLAADETEALLIELDTIEAYVLRRVDRLRDVWKAVEFTVSGDWSEADVAMEAALLEDAPVFTDTVRIDTTTGRIVK